MPPRRIGDRTKDELRAWAASMEVPAYTALQLLAGVEAPAVSKDGDTAAPATFEEFRATSEVKSPFARRRRRRC